MSKIGPKFLVFVSTFNFGRLTTPNWWIPSLDSFIESLIQQQDKLIEMGAPKASKNKAILDGETKNAWAKGKKKGKDKKKTKPKEKRNPLDGPSSSKKDK